MQNFKNKYMILIIKKNLIATLTFSFLFLHFASVSQVIYTETGNAPQTLRFDSYSITEKTYATKIIGSNYIYNDWQLADIKIVSDSGIIQDVYIKIDVLNNIVEIQDIKEIKVLPANLTKFIKLKQKNETYITKNAIGDYILNGFSKVIYNGKTSLLCNYSARIKEAQYNEALAVGNRDDELILVKKYYVFINKELILIEKSQRKLIKAFAYNPKIQQFIKDNHISPKNENDLITLLTYIDTII